MAIFNSYVKLPEGTNDIQYSISICGATISQHPGQITTGGATAAPEATANLSLVLPHGG